MGVAASAQTPLVQLRNVVSIVIGVGPAAEVAVPLKVMTCGLSGALSITEIVATRVPVVCGRKTTLTVHDAPAATKVPTHWSSTSPKSRPCCDMPLMNSDALPVLVSV